MSVDIIAEDIKVIWDVFVGVSFTVHTGWTLQLYTRPVIVTFSSPDCVYDGIKGSRRRK